MSVIYQFGSTPTATYKTSSALSSVYKASSNPSVISNYTPQPYLVDIVLVGGGGGGGYYYGGGGGGGQVLQVSSILVNYGGTYPVSIGSGGSGSQGPDLFGNISNGGNGGATTFGSYTAIGGGGGSSRGNTGISNTWNYLLTQNYSRNSGTMTLNSVSGLTSGCVIQITISNTTYFAEIVSVNSVAKTIQITGIASAISSGSELLIYDTNNGGSSGASGGGGCGADNAIVTSSYGSATFGNRGGYGTGNYFNAYSSAVGNVSIVDIMGGGGGGSGTQGDDGGVGAGTGGDALTFTFAGSSYAFSAGGGAGVDILSSYGGGGGPSGGAGGGGAGGSGGDIGKAEGGSLNSGSGGGGGGGVDDPIEGIPQPQGADGGSGAVLIYSYLTRQVIQINSSGYFYS